jgi:hypothetical protein
MSDSTVTREQTFQALADALASREEVTAFWEAGAAAFDRVDEWSDLDLMVAVKPGSKDSVIDVVDRALAGVAPVSLRYRLPEPAWHGHSQVFYMLEGASPYEFVDICFLDDDAENKFLEPETHGTVVVHFDRKGVVKQEPADPESVRARLAKRVDTLKATSTLGRTGALKELARGHDVEALAYYHATVLRPLVELLRIRHCPGRHQFHTRYIQYDLPEDIVERLRPFFFVRDADDIRVRHEEGYAWIATLLTELGEGSGD